MGQPRAVGDACRHCEVPRQEIGGDEDRHADRLDSLGACLSLHCARTANGAGDHGLAGPILGNLLVVSEVGLVTLSSCIVAALWMLIDPGERNPDHPKYRVLDADL
jgi:hypothetical protein